MKPIYQNENDTLSILQAGDILLFRPNKKTTWAQRLIMFGQSLIHKKHGHYDTVHAAICTGYNTNQKPMIAHITVVSSAKKPQAYFHEPLTALLSRDGDRGFITYRSASPTFATEISRVAANEKSYAACRYSVVGAASTLFSQTRKPPIQPTITRKTFCSRFVIEVLQKSQHNISANASQRHLSIPSKSTPKELESYLSQRDDFQRHCYIGQSSYRDLIQTISEQLKRLNQKSDFASQRKFREAERVFNQTLQVLSLHSESTEWQKARYLVRMMLPIFQRNTGLGVKTPTSYVALTQQARKLCLFKRDFSTSKQVDAPLAQPRCR